MTVFEEIKDFAVYAKDDDFALKFQLSENIADLLETFLVNIEEKDLLELRNRFKGSIKEIFCNMQVRGMINRILEADSQLCVVDEMAPINGIGMIMGLNLANCMKNVEDKPNVKLKMGD